MKYFKFVFVAILGIFLIASCGDENTTSSNLTQPDCVGFTKAEMATVGTLHNQYVTEVYEKVDFTTCTDCSAQIIHEFSQLNIDLTHYGKTQEELLEEAQALNQELGAIQFDIRNWQDHPFSTQAFIHLTTLMEEMDVMDNYSKFVANMIFLQTTVDSDNLLSCFDVELLTITIEVAKNSAYLWLPVENGGLDISNKGEVGSRWCWRCAAKADVTAAAGYFMAVGVGIIIPGANGAIAAGVGFASGFASAMNGLTNP